MSEKTYTRGPEPGGTFPSIGDLFNETVAEFSDNMSAYIMAGLGQVLVLVPVLIVGMFAIYFLMFGGMFGVILGGVGIGALLAEMVNEVLGISVIFASYLLSFLVPIVILMGGVGILITVLAPFNASLLRAVAAHQRGEKDIDIPGVFATLNQDLGNVIGVGILLGMLTVLGLSLCYLPALLVTLVLGFASARVALHRKGPFESLQTAASHFSAHISWYVTFGAVYIGLSMVATYVPILGSAFLLAFHTRAYRKVFGDGETAVI
jgi:hypothetical protein